MTFAAENEQPAASWSAITSTLSTQSVGVQIFGDELEAECVPDADDEDNNEGVLEAHGFDENGAYQFDGISFGGESEEDIAGGDAIDEISIDDDDDDDSSRFLNGGGLSEDGGDGMAADTDSVESGEDAVAAAVTATELRGCLSLRYCQAVIAEGYEAPMFLFNLSGDESEIYNLLDPELPTFDGALSGQLTERAMGLMAEFVASDPLFSAPIQYLHQKLPDGDPSLTGDGKFLRPFFDDSWYAVSIENMLDSAESAHSPQFRDLYLNPWSAPSDDSTARQCLDAQNESDDEAPNIVFILLDGMGWGDLSATTGKFPTPNMDSMYTHSVRLSRHYVHLAGSPSRTQFLTGRYAMNLGFGEFASWEDSVIGGIPIGQPTLAQWLRDFGDYATYGVGKWNLGYANRQLTPGYKGFDHFYGFYQDQIDYATKLYQYSWLDQEPQAVLDWFDDGEPVDITKLEDNTMTLQFNKIEEYLAAEGEKLKDRRTERAPFYLYASLQAMDTPLPDAMDADLEAICADLVEYDDGDEDYKMQRRMYCAMLLTLDNVMGDIVQSLKDHQLYENTLIVFTAANGGDTARGASNYPLRGSRGQLHDGNNRVMAALSGGVLAKEGLLDAERTQLFSNIDWTPTLLHFAGLLDCIGPADVSWDGESQKDLILSGGDDGQQLPRRTELILNIGDRELSSGAVLIEHEGSLFKFIVEDAAMASEEDQRRRDSWSTIRTLTADTDAVHIEQYDGDGGGDGAENEEVRYSRAVAMDGDAFLFEISGDESERYNLLDPELPFFDQTLNDQLMETADVLLREFLDGDDAFSPVIEALFEQRPEGNPSMVADGSFMRPFLNNAQYKSAIKKMFIDETYFHSKTQKALYEEQWRSPNAPESEEGADALSEDSDFEGDEMDSDGVAAPGEGMADRGDVGDEVLSWWVILLIVLAAVVVVAAVVICTVKCCRDRDRHHSDLKAVSYRYHDGRSDEYTLIGHESHDEDVDAPMSYQTFT